MRRRKIRNSIRLPRFVWNKIHLPRWNRLVQKDYWYNNLQRLELSIQVFQNRHYSLPPWSCHSHKLNRIYDRFCFSRQSEFCDGGPTKTGNYCLTVSGWHHRYVGFSTHFQFCSNLRWPGPQNPNPKNLKSDRDTFTEVTKYPEFRLWKLMKLHSQANMFCRGKS